MIPVLWKDSFSWGGGGVINYLVGLIEKDPWGTKRATKKFMDKRGNKWYWWLGYLLIIWAIVSAIVSLIRGEPTLVIVG